MTLATLAAIGLAFTLDLAYGEPPNAAHPVAWLGRVVDALDREWVGSERRARLIGVAIAGCVPVAAAAVVGGLVVAVGAIHPTAGAIAAAVVLYVTTSLRALLVLASDVVAATETDLEAAREDVRGLVGRDASGLSPALLRSGAVESAGENLADGLVATLLPFAVLGPISLPAAAAVAAWVKAVNTLDSMLGYPSKPIGTASARLDDAVMWVPARASALAIALAAGRPRALSRARRWADAPASPNSGWPMATLACALEVRLEKPGAYVLNADAALPTVEDGTRAIRSVGRAAVLAIVLAAVLAVASSAVAAELATAPPAEVGP